MFKFSFVSILTLLSFFPACLIAQAIGRPTVSTNGIVSSANFEKKLGSNALVTIFGTKLSGTGGICTADATNGAYPTSLCGTEVSLGVPVGLLYVSPTQINFISPTLREREHIKIIIKHAGGTSLPIRKSATASPSIFIVGKGANSIADATSEDSGNPITTTNPAKPLEKIAILVTGSNTADALLRGRFYTDSNRTRVTSKSILLDVKKVTNKSPGLNTVTVEIPVLVAGGGYSISIGTDINNKRRTPTLINPSSAKKLPIGTTLPK